MGTTCIHPNQKREIGITKAAASVERKENKYSCILMDLININKC
jgi:hypothetical protein